MKSCRAAFVIAIAYMLCQGLPVSAQEAKQPIKLLVNSPDEPMAKELSFDWIGRDELPNDRNAPSDGYATGLVIYILRQAGLPTAAGPIQKGVAWLKSNQRESGSWFTRSVNTNNYHFITHAGTAYAVLALKACE